MRNVNVHGMKILESKNVISAQAQISHTACNRGGGGDPSTAHTDSFLSPVRFALECLGLPWTRLLLFGGQTFDDLALSAAVVGAFQAIVEGGEFDVGFQPVGIGLDDFFQLVGGGLVLTRSALQHAHFVACHRRRGVEADGAFEVGTGLVEVATFAEDGAEVEVGVEVVGINLEGFAEGFLSFFYRPGLVAGSAGESLNAGEFGIELQGGIEIAAGWFVLVEVEEGGTGQEVGVGAIAGGGDVLDTDCAFAAASSSDER